MEAGGQLQESGELLYARALVISKPGDRIGLQVMHLPNGWSYVSDDLEMLHVMSGSFREPVSRISHRIEFTAR